MSSDRINALRCSAIVMGAGGMIGQLMMARVLMIVFHGNELTLAMVIAVWLFFEAAGAWLGGRFISRLSLPPLLFAGLFLLYSIVLPGSIISARNTAGGIFGLIPGQAMGLTHMALAAVLSVAPAAILHGSLFPFSVHMFNRESARSPAGLAYLIETAGAIAGGLVFVFLLAPRFTAMQVAMALLTAHLLLCSWLVYLFAHPARCRAVMARALAGAALFSVVFLPSVSNALHGFSLARSLPAGELADYRNSPYGNITVLRLEEQHVVFYDGRPIISLPHPDTARLQDYAWLAALSHARPDRVMVLGGGLGGLLYHLLEHPLTSLVYTELDPYLPGAVGKIDADVIRKEMDDPRVEIATRDGRLYLNRTRKKFDLIVIGTINTETLQANRFFTEEFFMLARSRMNEGGVLAFSPPGSETYYGEELAALNACLYRTARRVFKHLMTVPGENNIMLASDREIDLSPTAAAIRLRERGLTEGMFTEPYLAYRLDGERMTKVSGLLERTHARLNRDFEPAGFFYGLRYWGRMFAPGSLDALMRTTAARYYWLAAAAALVLLLFRLLFKSPGIRANRITFTIGTSGAAAMAFDVFTLFAFQSLFGHIYQLNGLFIAAFMGGMFLGAWTGYRRAASGGSSQALSRRLVLLDAAVLILLFVFYGMFRLLRAGMELPAAPVLSAAAAVLFAVASGAAIGAQFPIAAALMPEPSRTNAAGSAGRLYSADLAGGCIGGLAATILLFPLIGMAWTLLLLAAFKLVSLALIMDSGIGQERVFPRKPELCS